MMGKKDRFLPMYSSGLTTRYELEGSGSSGRVDTEFAALGSSTKKWIDLNSASRTGFPVPMQVIPLSKLSPSDRKSLVLRLTSELEQIRMLRNKVEFQRTKSVNAVTGSSSSDILSCSDAAQQKGPNPMVGYLRKSSSSGSGPGNWKRGKTGKFESAKRNIPADPNAGLFKQCDFLLKKLMGHQHGWVFITPVDPVKLNIPDYFTVIKNPMDLGTIKSKLSSRTYASPLDFAADVRLTFSNAKTYNPPGNNVHVMACVMSDFFEWKWKDIEKKLLSDTTEKPGFDDHNDVSTPLAPSKKRKISPIQCKVLQEPIKPKMTDEEKQKLSRELEDLLEDLPDNIIEFLKAQSANAGNGNEDELEIDIDDLSDETLFTLRKLLDDYYLREKNKNHSKSEACEIEMPNVSGLSNSSLQADKGNDPTDEDVDIGEDDPPVSSCPPVETEEGRNEKHIESASISRLDRQGNSQQDANANNSDGHQDAERDVSPERLYRAAILKERFADTILKAQEKTLNQDDKVDPEKLRREKEELEMRRRKEKARLQAEAKAAEDARKRAEEAAAAEERRRRELEREAAREALLKMEKTVEMNENSRFLKDLEMLSVVPPEQLPSSVDEMSPDQSQDGFGSFKFGGSNPLEQLGLYMKVDDEEEEGEPPSVPNVVVDDEIEEGEVD